MIVFDTTFTNTATSGKKPEKNKFNYSSYSRKKNSLMQGDTYFQRSVLAKLSFYQDIKTISIEVMQIYLFPKNQKESRNELV